jgi:hypothetical protein
LGSEDDGLGPAGSSYANKITSRLNITGITRAACASAIEKHIRAILEFNSQGVATRNSLWSGSLLAGAANSLRHDYSIKDGKTGYVISDFALGSPGILEICSSCTLVNGNKSGSKHGPCSLTLRQS